MKLGLSSYTLSWAIGVPGYETPVQPLKVQQLIEATHRLGLNLVQISDNLPLHMLDDTQLQSLREVADRLGVTIEVGTRGTEPAHLQRYKQIALTLGSTLVRTLITSEGIEQAEEDLRLTLPDFAAAGVTLAVENHGLHTTDQLIQLFQKLDTPYIGSCLDTVNSFSALEAPDEVIENLAPFLVNLHIKDFEIKRVDHQMGFVILGTPAGKGRLDIPKMLDIVRDRKKQANAILELWTPYTQSVEETIKLEQQWLMESLNYLQKFDFS